MLTAGEFEYSGGLMKGCLVGLFFGALALVVLYAIGSNSEEPRTQNRPITTDNDANFEITQSCDEIYADYMTADPGSNEERWALEAAAEKGC